MHCIHPRPVLSNWGCSCQPRGLKIMYMNSPFHPSLLCSCSLLCSPFNLPPCSLKRGFLWMLARHPSLPWLEEPCPVLLGFCVPWLSQPGSPGTRRSQGGCKAIRRAVRSGCSYLRVKSRDVAMSELQSEVWGTQVEWQLLT